MDDATWQPSDGTYHEEDVLVAERVRIVRAQRMCCPEHGIETICLTTIEGQLGGIPISVTFELTLDAAESMAFRYSQIRDQRAIPRPDDDGKP